MIKTITEVKVFVKLVISKDLSCIVRGIVWFRRGKSSLLYSWWSFFYDTFCFVFLFCILTNIINQNLQKCILWNLHYSVRFNMKFFLITALLSYSVNPAFVFSLDCTCSHSSGGIFWWPGGRSMRSDSLLWTVKLLVHTGADNTCRCCQTSE